MIDGHIHHADDDRCIYNDWCSACDFPDSHARYDYVAATESTPVPGDDGITYPSVGIGATIERDIPRLAVEIATPHGDGASVWLSLDDARKLAVQIATAVSRLELAGDH